MKFALPLLTLASLAAADFSIIPTSTPASAALAGVTDLPASVTGDLYTSLATAIWSVDVKYFNADKYETVLSDLYSAAAKASDSEKVVPSLALSSLAWPDITPEAWYKKNVPKDDMEYVSKYVKDWSDAYTKSVGDGEDDEGVAGRNGAVIWAAAGIAGFVAVMIAL